MHAVRSTHVASMQKFCSWLDVTHPDDSVIDNL